LEKTPNFLLYLVSEISLIQFYRIAQMPLYKTTYIHLIFIVVIVDIACMLYKALLTKHNVSYA